MTATQTTAELVAWRLLLRGRVQGLGVRPAVYRLAQRHQLTGQVCNSGAGVEIIVEGTPCAVANFASDLPQALPAGVSLSKFLEQPTELTGYEAFTIVQPSATGPLATSVPSDLAMCEACGDEVLANSNRRYQYPLTSCTQCGPRYSLIRNMPYERADTTLAEFEFCSTCDAEYATCDQRRFHAQTNACAACGPQVWAVDVDLQPRGAADEAMRYAVEILRAGKILAIKGAGGYQLLCDATSESAVCTLRAHKHRTAKPLAVLVASLEAAQELALLNDAERATLCSPANPIVLLQARSGTLLSPSIHPGLPEVGLLLPTTPLHLLLATQFGRPLVCTSGNDDGEPLLYDECAAERALGGIADAWLHHNRPIAHPIDDSVVRIIADRPATIRLARGLAPLSLELNAHANPPILALGGHLKVAAAWSNGVQAVLGPHIGSLDTLAARERYVEQLDAWQMLYRFRPALLVHDLHPDFFTTQWAAPQGVPTLAVQHHHAHVVASMLEHRWLERTVLGVAWDGAGYGPDGTIWGGEFLVATATGYQRLARLRPFQLPGGDRCAHEPWRTAFSLLTQVVGNEAARAVLPRSVTSTQVSVLSNLLKTTSNASPVTTSAGRLFDAAAYLCLGIERVDYEGQAAMLLEAATIADAPGEYRFPLVADELDWRPLLQDLLADRSRGERPGVMALRFHRALAAGIACVCRTRPDLPVTLSGGVFQNRVLTELVAESLAGHSQPRGLPGVIPVGDGGLAAGQLAIASAMYSPHKERPRCV